MEIKKYQVFEFSDFVSEVFTWLPQQGAAGGTLLFDTKKKVCAYYLPAKPTFELFNKLPDKAPLELVNGQLIYEPMTMFNHEKVNQNLRFFFNYFVRKVEEKSGLPAGEVVGPNFPVFVSDKNYYIPDLVYVSPERDEIITKRGLTEGPCLAVEILSKSTRENDEKDKHAALESVQTREYWIIHPDEKWVKQFVKNNENNKLELIATLDKPDDVLKAKVLEGFELPLPKLFKGVRKD